jgi:hypothetical protein
VLLTSAETNCTRISKGNYNSRKKENLFAAQINLNINTHKQQVHTQGTSIVTQAGNPILKRVT